MEQVFPESAQNAEPPMPHSSPRHAEGMTPPSGTEEKLNTMGRKDDDALRAELTTLCVELSGREEIDDATLCTEEEMPDDCKELLRNDVLDVDADDVTDDTEEVDEPPNGDGEGSGAIPEEEMLAPLHSNKQLSRSCVHPGARRQTLSG